MSGRSTQGAAALVRLDDVLIDETPRFRDRMEFTFSLSSLSSPQPVVVNGHNIVRFTVDLRSSGFAGEIAFMIRDDQAFKSTERDLLVELFRTPELLKIHLGMRPQHTQEKAATRVIPFLEIEGLSTEKSLVERVARHLSGGQVSYRLYHLRYADPAQVLWRQHFPCVLYTQTSLQAVITQNLNSYIAVDFIDTTLADIQEMIFLGLNSKNRPSERASFYDLLMWQLDETERIWLYDYTQKKYQIIKTKLLPTGIDVVADDVNDIFTYYPAPPRYAEALLNDYTEKVQNQPVVAADPQLLQCLVPGVRQDFLWNTPIELEFEHRLLQRTQAFLLPKPEFVMSYRLFPSLPYAPGAGIDFSISANQTEFASVAMAIPQEAQLEICRVFRIRISGQSLEDDVEAAYDGQAPASFELAVHVWLEAASNPARRGPPYVLPKYPVHIEGKILSEIGLPSGSTGPSAAGQPVEETYQFYPDAQTYINKYKAFIPLWNDQIITMPYNPNMDPGHFYFPAYKNERVLVALYYDKAFLKRFLDWRATAQLPLETQGDHLLLGKTPVNRTSVRHLYQDEQPVFEIERLHLVQSFDTELFQMAEGSLLLTVGTPLGAPPPGVPVAAPPAGEPPDQGPKNG